MDWKQFISSLIDSLAWPFAIAFIFWLFRKPIARRIKELRKLRYRDAEAEFGDAVEDAEIAADRADLPALEPATELSALSTELSSEIANAPRAAVIEAWLAVDRELEQLAQEADAIPTTRRWSPETVASELETRGVIEPGFVEVIRDLHRARNVAAHVQPYTVERDEVIDYVKLAGRVRSALRLARESLRAASTGRTSYDLLVYHDASDQTERTGGAIPSVGDEAEGWFGEKVGRDRYVAAVGPGIHEGRVTVVLAHGNQPMPEIQALIDREPE